MREEIREILPFVEKPYRYIGGEVGERKKKWADVCTRLCLTFPDTYEIGMSNIGMSILYSIVNDQEDMLAERAFTPWPDMEGELTRRNLALFSLESQHSLKDFDVVGISLPYELSFTNILTILSLADIPWRSAGRQEDDPLVIGGGPGAFNPEPVADFFDAIVIGDGENVILDVMRLVEKSKAEKNSRTSLLEKLSRLSGVYVPSLEFSGSVKKSFVDDLEKASYPVRPVVPYAAVHNRVGIEVSRGCTRGCRFCQAGFVYRPVRRRSLKTAYDLALGQLSNTGQEDFSFLSLSLGDYPHLDELLKAVESTWTGCPINAQLPSLRAESLSDETLNFLGKGRSGSFTFAPEAATERMRRMINKGNTDEDLYASVEKVFAAGWHQVKLYFMIGLPGETQEELDGIVKMANRCLDIGKRYHSRAEVTVSTSTFVPKPHTPLQWAGQISTDEIIEKQTYLKRQLKRRGLYYRWHDAYMSRLEAILSRGDRRLADVIEEVHRLGGRFDAWDERFNRRRWEEVFDKCGLDVREFLKPRDYDYKFPWDHLYGDLKKKFLWKEYEKSLLGEPTPDCTIEKCGGCGVCEGKDLSEGSDDKSDVKNQEFILREKTEVCGEIFRYRVGYSKLGSAAFLGHHELINILKHAFRSANLPLCYSQGYHPHPKIGFGRAISVGTESLCEYCDVELSAHFEEKIIVEKLAGVFPDGICVNSVEEISKDAEAIDRSIAASVYTVGGFSKCDLGQESLAKGVERFNSLKEASFQRRRGEKSQNVDLKAYVAELAVLDKDAIRLTLNEVEPPVRVLEAVAGIFDFAGVDLRSFNVRKTGVKFKQ